MIDAVDRRPLADRLDPLEDAAGIGGLENIDHALLAKTLSEDLIAVRGADGAAFAVTTMLATFSALSTFVG